MRGSIAKRCTCPTTYDARGKRRNCRKDHGSWYYVVDLGRGPDGKRQQERVGGFRTADDAETAMAATIKALDEGTHTVDGGKTVGQWLEEWIETKVAGGLRPTTERSYRQHIRAHLVPRLGHLRLRDLRPAHVSRMLRDIATGPVGVTSVRRVHATLRSALASAQRQQLVAMNVATSVELPAAPKSKVRPWEPAELGRFLDSLGADRLAPVFELIAATGLRRGEACGLRWADVDLPRAVLTVHRQLVQGTVEDPQPCASCGQLHRGYAFGPPKTASGDARIVELDDGTVGMLLAHRLRQDAERADWASAYLDHGLVFAREDGTPIPPDSVSKRFRALAAEAGVRRVRLHDLRHGAASLMLASGADLTLVSKRLGHSSVSLTADTYSHLLAGVGREAAERAQRLVPRNRGDQPVTNPPESAGPRPD